MTERPGTCLKAAAILEWCVDNGRQGELSNAWNDAVGRGRGWKKRAEEGRKALVAQAPELNL